MPDEELKDFEEKMLAALMDLHNGFEICHKDIKADYILLPRSPSSRSTGFVVIDRSEAIIRKYTLDAVWKKACKQDIHSLREIFMDERSAKVGARNSLASFDSNSDLCNYFRPSWPVASLFRRQHPPPNSQT